MSLARTGISTHIDDAKFGKCISMQRSSRNGSFNRKGGAFRFHAVLDIPIEMHDIWHNIMECLREM